MASSAAHSQAGEAKTVEHRAIHSALRRSNSSHAGLSPSLSRFSKKFSAASDDYPVFTPTYEEEPLSGHPYDRLDQKYWSRFMLKGDAKCTELVKSDTKSVNELSSLNNKNLLYSTEHLSNTSSCLDHKLIMQTAPGAEILKSSSRSPTGDSIARTTSNTCHSNMNNFKQTKPKGFSGIVASLNKQSSLASQLKSKGPTFSWLFHRTKKKPKPELSSNTNESEDLSQIIREWGVFSLETLKKELQESNEKRYFALSEVAEMRSSLGELQQKLASLESYCEEMKKALKQEIQGKETLVPNASKRPKLISSRSKDDSMPVGHEAMVEGFLQIVSEARLSINHFCKTLISQFDETDCSLVEKLNKLLHPHQITIDKKNSKEVLYHLEALINQYLYQDFENCVFQRNGSPKVLDSHQNRLENFSAFVSFRNVSWNDVLRKGTKNYCEDFNMFCDQKMSSVVSILKWWRPWPEMLLQSFFIAAKCIWLLHLLAFSFNPPVMIFRVDENRSFDLLYMEDVLGDKQQRAQTPAQVKVMVMPGFYVQDRVFRCRVLCNYGAL